MFPKIFTYVTSTDDDDDDLILLPAQGTEEFTELAMSMKNIHVDNSALDHRTEFGTCTCTFWYF